jgi:hypothetical protein
LVGVGEGVGVNVRVGVGVYVRVNVGVLTVQGYVTPFCAEFTGPPPDQLATPLSKMVIQEWALTL